LILLDDHVCALTKLACWYSCSRTCKFYITNTTDTASGPVISVHHSQNFSLKDLSSSTHIPSRTSWKSPHQNHLLISCLSVCQLRSIL